MVNVAHDGHDWRTTDQIGLVFYLDTDSIFHFFVDKQDVVSKFVGHNGQRLFVEALVHGRHDSERHTGRNDFGRSHLHHVGYFKQGNVLGEFEYAFAFLTFHFGHFTGLSAFCTFVAADL